MANYEPCSICEEYIEGVICDKDKCPVAIMKAENTELQLKNSELEIELKAMRGAANSYKAENERLKAEIRNTDNILNSLDRPLVEIKSEAIKELAEKISEIFMRYAHLHSYAEGARKDYIETVDGTEIEMQSVWDVITLQKNGMAEYEEMGRLQKNIEIIEKERLLTELEKDFRLLVKEMVGE